MNDVKRDPRVGCPSSINREAAPNITMVSMPHLYEAIEEKEEDKWKSRMERARKLHRPSLKNWQRDRFYETFPLFREEILRQAPHEYERFVLFKDGMEEGPSLPVILDAKHLTAKDFFTRYEATDTPCVLLNIPAGYDGGKFVGEWKGYRSWGLDYLAKDEALRERLFKCGEDDDGCSVKVRLKHFLRYLEENNDDSPLYIFDTAFDEDRLAKRILSDYTVPSYFSDDLFRYVSESRRPPYRWFLVGPERSGTTVHIDPLSTNAWNTLIYGKKRWVLFPPHVPKRIVKGKDCIRKGEDDEAVHYFTTILPRIKRRAALYRDREEYRDFACYEFTQHAGETCFIPNGWWHAVLNVTHTVGVTQNFCSPRNFDQVWRKTRSGRKKMAYKWLCEMEKHEPRLYARARALNNEDNYSMKYDPQESQRFKESENRRSNMEWERIDV